ncbi:MAG TPA: glycosyltransferase [Candidatus Paceibacterota bacterium]|nr:glycosyltransferase [Candidatus Paceibacterota bacterium]
MKKNLISIITPTHNRSDFLRQNIISLQKQKEDGFEHEHIIVDNDSTDNTAEMVAEMAKEDPRIIYIKNNRNIGPGDALNIGFARSNGDLIVPADDDDLFPLSSLQFRFNFMTKNPDIDWSYGHSIFIDENNKLWKDLLEYRTTRDEKSTLLETLLVRCFVSGGTVTIRRNCIEKVSGWTVERPLQDYDMWLRLANADCKLGHIDSYLYYYRIHQGQITNFHKKENTYIKEAEYYRNFYKNSKK